MADMGGIVGVLLLLLVIALIVCGIQCASEGRSDIWECYKWQGGGITVIVPAWRQFRYLGIVYVSVDSEEHA